MSDTVVVKKTVLKSIQRALEQLDARNVCGRCAVTDSGEEDRAVNKMQAINTIIRILREAP